VTNTRAYCEHLKIAEEKKFYKTETWSH
jgi:hypothetical protein